MRAGKASATVQPFRTAQAAGLKGNDDCKTLLCRVYAERIAKSGFYNMSHFLIQKETGVAT